MILFSLASDARWLLEGQTLAASEEGRLSHSSRAACIVISWILLSFIGLGIPDSRRARAHTPILNEPAFRRVLVFLGVAPAPPPAAEMELNERERAVFS